MSKPYLLSLPYDLLENISQYLDLCSNTSLMDTCRHMRYLYLSSQYIWRRILLDPTQTTDLHRIYSSLRKLDDSNGLRGLIYEVVMDSMDDADLSPIVMLLKFPKLRKLSARYRKTTTNLEVDVKLLQEMLRSGSVKRKSFPLEELKIYHYNMDYEPLLEAYQKTLNNLSITKVKLDVKHCEYIQHTVSATDDNRQTVNAVQQDDSVDHFPSVDTTVCQRVVSIEARCWSCGDLFRHCWICVPNCGGCKIKRIPPLANDNQRNHRSKQHVASEDDFSVFG